MSREKPITSRFLLAAAILASVAALPLFYMFALAEAFDESDTGLRGFLGLTVPFFVPALLALASFLTLPKEHRSKGNTAQIVIMLLGTGAGTLMLTMLILDAVSRPPPIDTSLYPLDPKVTLLEASASDKSIASVRVSVHNSEMTEPVRMNTSDVRGLLICSNAWSWWKFGRGPGRVELRPSETREFIFDDAAFVHGEFGAPGDCVVRVQWEARGAPAPHEWVGTFFATSEISLHLATDAGTDAAMN